MQSKKIYFLIVLLLCTIGIFMVYSASNIIAFERYNDPFYHFKRQFIFLCIGLFLLWITSNIDYHIYIHHAFFLLFLGFILLSAVLINGIGQSHGGSQSWFHLGPFSFQPSELFKLFLIFYYSKMLAKNYHQTKRLKTISKPLFALFLGFGLIMMQPDFGSGFIIICSCIALLFVTQLPTTHFFYLGVLGMIGAVVLVVAAPYRLVRLLSFLDPFSDPLGSGFQAIQALYAIGPGGLLGAGFNNSIQKHFFLPEPQTDFIFAIFAEEFGFIGCVALIALYTLFFICGIHIALKSKDLEGFYLAFGITTLITIQTIVNLCVVCSLFPITGITLPFISYGGSSLIITLASVGIVLNISNHK